MSTIKVNTITDASGGSNAVLQGVASPPNSMGFRNRIINGDMRIDQRNGGAAVTPVNGQYVPDRWRAELTQVSKYSVQQVSDAPSGFMNSLLVTSLSAYSVLSTDQFNIRQCIEGLNTADLMYGTANATTVTVGFWVKSSLTGTFGASLANSSNTQLYNFSYTISAANTWEYKTAAIVGPTSGTWQTTNLAGIFIRFNLGLGATYGSTTVGSWVNGTDIVGNPSTTSVVSTNGATLYITGVQLEAGSVASPFERRDIGRELMMCQRYYFKQGAQGAQQYIQIGAFLWDGQTNCSFNYQLPVAMRSTPTFSKFGSFSSANGTPNIAAMTIDTSASTTKAVNLICASGNGGVNGYSTYIRASNDGSAYFDFSAEL